MQNLTDNIKRFRRAKELTQEQLASMLGIVPQAVSKWECGDGLPDITLIPAIAAALNVTTDDLFGMDDERRKRRIKEVLDEHNKILFHDEEFHLADGAEYLRKQLRELPQAWEIWFVLGMDLTQLGDEKSIREAVEIYERIYEQGGISQYRDNALAVLCMIYTNYLHDDEKAQEYIAMLPHKYSSYEYLGIGLMKGVKLRDFIEDEIGDAFERLHSLCGILAEPVNADSELAELCGTLEQRVAMYELAVNAMSALKGHTFGGRWAQRCSQDALHIADIYVENGDEAAALDWLERAASFCEPFGSEKRAAYVAMPNGVASRYRVEVTPSEYARENLLDVLGQENPSYIGHTQLTAKLSEHSRYKAVIDRLNAIGR
ncbi:MAG: helix-turn-helix domain-containing protein [Oscillospiraceae bacterium]|jgi:transcriptional regulator with XRE-family HTH domain|nr:helix-turn-helix domain-containing protein [Oscillospiraceae bacterium]